MIKRRYRNSLVVALTLIFLTAGPVATTVGQPSLAAVGEPSTTTIASHITDRGRNGVTDETFNRPQDVVIDPATGYAYISDNINRAIKVYDVDGNFIKTLYDGYRDDRPFVIPSPDQLALSGDKLFVSSSYSSQYNITVLDKTTGDLITGFDIDSSSGIGFLSDLQANSTHLMVLDTNDVKMDFYVHNGTFVSDTTYPISSADGFRYVNGALFILDQASDYIWIFHDRLDNPDVFYDLLFPSEFQDEFEFATGFAVDDDFIYLGLSSSRVLILDTDGFAKGIVTNPDPGTEGTSTTGIDVVDGRMVTTHTNRFYVSFWALDVSTPNVVSSSSSAQISWEHPSITNGANVSHYKVYRGSDSGNLQFLAETTSQHYIDNLVNPGDTYFYAVTAVNAFGETKLSEAVPVTIQSGQGTVTLTEGEVTITQDGETVEVTITDAGDLPLLPFSFLITAFMIVLVRRRARR